MESIQPLVSVIINCYNGEKYLREAIDSVIAQTYTNWEIIFWDNQSTDSTAAIVKSYKDKRIRYFYAPTHSTLGEARNRAISKAFGEYVAFLDSDDIWCPCWMDYFVNAFEKDSEVSVVYSRFVVFGEGYERVVPCVNPEKGIINLKNFINNYKLGMSASAFRLSAARSNKIEFESSFTLIEDYDFYIRLGSFGSIMYIPQVCARYRAHSENLTNKSNMWAKEFIALRDKVLANKETYQHLRGYIPNIDKKIRSYRLSQYLIDGDYGSALKLAPLSLIKYLLLHGKKKPLRH